MRGEAQLVVRPARTADVDVIRGLVDVYAPDRRLLGKATVTLFEDIQEFVVAEQRGEVVGCGALHVMWRDLAEVRTVAVRESMLRRGVGGAIVRALIDRAKRVGASRVFCLTFEVDFFAGLGFEVIEGTPVSDSVFTELLQSEDEGVAEFLDLERVKPNTLGNTRMLLRISRNVVT